MSKINQIILEAVLPAIKGAGKVEMEAVLSGIKEHNAPEIYQNTLQGLHSDFTLLKEGALKTGTRVDGILDLGLEAVKESGVADRIVIS
jgi:hypothetical protein